MAGYCDFSKSWNAIDAEEEGKFPASIAAKKIGVKCDAIKKYMHQKEWHHTGLYFKRTDYYDVAMLLKIKEASKNPEACLDLAREDWDDVERAIMLYGELLKFKKEKKEVKVFHNCRVEWDEWEESYRGWKKHARKLEHCTVTDKGATMLDITDANGRTFKKKRDNVYFSEQKNV